jgi:ABC-type branched-subunit amino acid transport system permease subunit
MGLFIVLVVVFAPRGLLGVLDRVLRRREQRDE